MTKKHSNLFRLGAQAIVGLGAIKVASLIKCSFIVGSYAAFFSGRSVAVPLVGAFGGFLTTFMALGVSGFVYGMRSSLGLSLVYHIPGFCAAGYWISRHWLVRVWLPVICMIAFMAHPVGFQACFYSWYWLVPVVLYVVKATGIFWQALGSTFIAHAVGSVIWIYVKPMTPQVWLSLIPVVAVERLLFAASMVVVHTVISFCVQRRQNVQEAFCVLAQRTRLLFRA